MERRGNPTWPQRVARIHPLNMKRFHKARRSFCEFTESLALSQKKSKFAELFRLLTELDWYLAQAFKQTL